MKHTGKFFTRILCLLLSMIMLAAAAVSCAPDTTSPDDTSDDTSVGSDSSDTSADVSDSVETSGGSAEVEFGNYLLSDFQIVYSYEASANVITAVYDLKKAIKTETGVSLKTRNDSAEEKKLACEILVGEVDREETSVLDAIAEGEYIIRTVPTADGVKLILGGTTDAAIIEAITVFTAMLQEQEVVDDSLALFSLDVQVDYLSKYDSYHLEIGEPVVIAQGEYTSERSNWGYMQFPQICRTTEGSLYIAWSLRPDTIDAFEGVGGSAVVSDDNGLTWHAPYRTITLDRGVTMSNGDKFAGFVGKDAYVTDAFESAVPVLELKRRNVTVYYSDEVEGLDTEVTARFVSAGGVQTISPVTINWPYRPAYEHSGSRYSPVARTMGLMNNSALTAIGDTLYYATYAYGFDLETGDLTEYPDCFNIYFFRSDDCGMTWDCISQLNATEEIYDPNDNDAEGWGEPAMLARPDGSVILLLRSGSGLPMYFSRSTDGCLTWSEPVLFDNVGVYPHLLELECGVTVASYGRPGVFVRTTNDPAGLVWDDPVEIELSDCPYTDPFLHDTCAYTDMVALDDHTFILVYSDFNYPNEDGDGRKAILARTITVVADS